MKINVANKYIFKKVEYLILQCQTMFKNQFLWPPHIRFWIQKYEKNHKGSQKRGSETKGPSTHCPFLIVVFPFFIHFFLCFHFFGGGHCFWPLWWHFSQNVLKMMSQCHQNAAKKMRKISESCQNIVNMLAKCCNTISNHFQNVAKLWFEWTQWPKFKCTQQTPFECTQWPHEFKEFVPHDPNICTQPPRKNQKVFTQTPVTFCNFKLTTICHLYFDQKWTTHTTKMPEFPHLRNSMFY